MPTHSVPAIPSLLNPAWLILVGVDSYHAKERRQIKEVPAGVIDGTFESDPLCVFQEKEASMGIRAAELSMSKFGWSVRNVSGLYGFSVLAGVRTGELDGSFECALKWATAWQAEEPLVRSVLVRAVNYAQLAA